MSDCCVTEARNARERKLLWVVLSLNLIMFGVEFVAGWLANSSGLLADSLDMLADAAVYSLSLYAVGHSLNRKARAAMVNGSLQLMLGCLVLLDVGHRIWVGSSPQPEMMTAVALLALMVNMACFALLFQFRQGDINLKASWICSRNDMLANAGVLAAAGLVTWLESPWPDWLIGAVIAGIVIRSALLIIRDARLSLRFGEPTVSTCNSK